MNSNHLIDEEEHIFAVRRSSEDKLTYKNNISKAIERCNMSRGTSRFSDSVESLIDTIFFDIDGYRLKSEIEDIRDSLSKDILDFIAEQEKVMGRKIRYHAYQAKLKIRVNEWYWKNLFRRLIQLLAQHNLLLETERKISVIQDTKRYDEEETV